MIVNITGMTPNTVEMHSQLNLVAMLALCNKGSICNLSFLCVIICVWVGGKESAFCLFFYCCDKDHVQKQLEERVHFILQLAESITEGRQNTNSRDMKECCLLVCLVCFLTHSRQDLTPRGRTAHSGLGPSTSVATGQCNGGVFSIEIPFSQMALACIKWKQDETSQYK